MGYQVRSANQFEEMLIDELKGLCTTCRHVSHCPFFRRADKAIIDCEMFDADESAVADDSLRGLCKTCDNAAHCSLPGRRIGVWHCNEFK